ncbi:MAG: AraC family transcriptional regulator [Verrucomicrobiota bacterium]|nr:AraC family transcriptional regulator [Verrucomicrobiota bacterium]
MNDKKDNIEVHRIPQGMEAIHKKYGLWISHVNSSILSRGTFSGYYRYFEYYSLSHMTNGSGSYRLPNGTLSTISPGKGMLISPGFIHWYGAIENNFYKEDSICFSGPLADRLFDCEIIKSGMLEIGRARRLLDVIKLVTDPAHTSQINANIALQTLLIDLYNENSSLQQKDKYAYIKKLVKKLKKNPEKWWTLTEMAGYCNLSIAQFRRVFKKQVGLLPKKYIDRLKIQQIIPQLLNNDKQINELAKEFGYLDPYHFSRRFKQLTGFSPTHYKREFS